MQHGRGVSGEAEAVGANWANGKDATRGMVLAPVAQASLKPAAWRRDSGCGMQGLVWVRLHVRSAGALLVGPYSGA